MPPTPPQRNLDRLVADHDLGASAWLTVTQSMIDGFGAVTMDQDPMHVNPAWAATGPFGSTIAFGFLTISLLTHLMHNVMGTDAAGYDASDGYYLNYGFDRLRLVSPVPVGSRIRGHFRVLDVRPDPKGHSVVKTAVSVEIEGQERPALVAEWLSAWVPPSPR